MAARNSQDFAFCRRATSMAYGRLGLAHRPGAGEQGLAPEPIELGFKRRSPHLFDRLQPGGDRRKRRFGLADRQLRVGLECQQHMLPQPETIAVQPLADLGQPLLAFARGAERPSIRAKGVRVKGRDAVLLADPQSPFGIVGDRRWLMAKDVNERGVTQCVGEGHRVPERLGTSYRCSQLIEGPIGVTEHPGDQHREELACHGGMGTRPIRESHVRIEHLETPPKFGKRRLDFPLPEQHPAERHVRPDETSRIVKPFGYTQRLLGKVLRLFHIE
jgi:hypothetical protein